MTKKSIITGSVLIMLALFFALVAIGQQPTTNQPTAQPAAAYAWSPVIAEGTMIGTRLFDKTTRYTNQIVFGDDTVIVGAEFPDPRRVGVKGLYNASASQVVAEEGERIQGSIIEHLINSRPSDVQIDSSSGIVAFRAAFSGNGCASGGNCNGLFLCYRNGERKLIATEVNTVNGSGTYLLIPDGNGKIASPPGMWAAPTVTATSAAGGGDDNKRSWWQRHGWIVMTVPIRGPWGMGGQAGGSTLPINQDGQQQGARQGQSGVHAPAALKLEPMPALPNCAAPSTFPLPWSDLGSAAGPITFVRADSGGFPAARYIPGGGRPTAVGGWGRRTYFTGTCTPVAVALWDNSGKGPLEVHSPVGLVLFLDQNRGVYKLNGADDVAPPPSGNPIDSELRINRRCEILLPVTYAKLGAGKAVLKGTPLNKANCPTE